MGAIHETAGYPGKILISWTLSGGIIGGILGMFLTLNQQIPGYELFTTLLGLFGFGVVVGLLHGFILGVFSKEKGVPFSESFKKVGIGFLYTLLGIPVAFLATMWLGMTFYVIVHPHLGSVLGMIIGWWIALAILIWTAAETWIAIRIIATAWPDFSIVALIVAIVFGVMVWFFHSFYPYIFQTWFNLKEAVFISGGISVLIVGPMTTLAAVGLRRIIFVHKIIQKLEID